MKVYYVEIERIENEKIAGKSFRIIELYFWQKLSVKLNEMLCMIEEKNNCSTYVVKIQKL